ncbi:DUF2062 domain-containing protein [Candidatus Aerophobetes bacterium]|nr:DUF2062 domain-containing protein [Candidatus Aerophobetes bacterium]
MDKGKTTQKRKKIPLAKKYWRKLKRVFKRALLANDSPEKLARGFAIGVFWGVMPTFGFAILFSLPTSVLFKANRLTAIMGTFISNPLTSTFFMIQGTYLGNFILRAAPIPFTRELLTLTRLLQISRALFLGTLILAGGIAVLSYGLFLLVILVVKQVRKGKGSIIENNSKQ